jgi:hypothetical protein
MPGYSSLDIDLRDIKVKLEFFGHPVNDSREVVNLGIQNGFSSGNGNSNEYEA